MKKLHDCVPNPNLKPIPARKHGTVAGYRAHNTRCEPACPPCKKAWRIYYARRTGALSRYTWDRLTPEKKQAVIEFRKEVKQAEEAKRARNLGRNTDSAKRDQGLEAVQEEQPVAVPRSPGPEECWTP